MPEKDYFPVMNPKDCLPPEGSKEGTLHWIRGLAWLEERVWVGTGWKRVGCPEVVSPVTAGQCGWKYIGPISSPPTVPDGVFSFSESFPGPHMIRVRLTKDKAWDALQKLAKMLEGDKPVYTLDYFGTLSRDQEDNNGNPIEGRNQ